MLYISLWSLLAQSVRHPTCDPRVASSRPVDVKKLSSMAKVLGQGLNHTDSASAYPSCISGTRRDSADQRRMWPHRGSLNYRGVAYVCVHLQTLSNILCQLYACTKSRCKLQPCVAIGQINVIFKRYLPL